MNCADVIAYVVEPVDEPREVREHLEGCEACRARQKESRRVAALIATLPAMDRPDIAGRVMANIGFGNGRPTRDKIAEQLHRLREELEAISSDVEEDELRWRPSPGESSVVEVLKHLPSEEDVLRIGALKAAGAFTPTGHGNGETSASNLPTGGAVDDLRRVRERTLRLISRLRDADLGVEGAELLRSIYRHEADHTAQIADTLWRSRRLTRLS